MPTLVERVQALPPELYQEIYDLTFTPMSNEVFITEQYEPPASLQVSRATRTKFGKCYYGTCTIFYVDREVLPNWLESLAAPEIPVQGEIRLAQRVFDMKGKKAHDVINTFIGEWSRAMRFKSALPFQSCIESRLSFRVAFGEPEEMGWVVLRDAMLACASGRTSPLQDAATFLRGILGTSGEPDAGRV